MSSGGANMWDHDHTNPNISHVKPVRVALFRNETASSSSDHREQRERGVSCESQYVPPAQMPSPDCTMPHVESNPAKTVM